MSKELDSYMGSPYVWKPKKFNLKKEILKKGFMKRIYLLIKTLQEEE